ncbi:MAG: hypothetical protein ACRDN0_07905 [Trebonia sp.]
MSIEQTAASPGGTRPDPAESLEVLRHVWRGQSSGIDALDDGSGKACKRMTDAGVGFDEFAAGDEADRATAWRDRLAREGKLSPAGGSLRDLVLGPVDSTADDTA